MGDRISIPALHELRRDVERMLASKHHCSPDLGRKGTELVRAFERAVEAVGAAHAYFDESLADCDEADESVEREVRALNALARFDFGEDAKGES